MEEKLEILLDFIEGIEQRLQEAKRDGLEETMDKIKNIEPIWNVDDFEKELERQGLMTEKLEEFIENYMRFDND